MTSKSDRNFDELADRFIDRIHNSEKGALRREIIERDMHEVFPGFYQNTVDSLGSNRFEACDIGAGAGYFSMLCARHGHRIIYSELSERLLSMAKKEAIAQQLENKIDWHHGSFQDLNCTPLDLIFCHGVIEWLVQPEDLFAFIDQRLKPKGRLSLCFYNADAAMFANLLKGNFNWVERYANKQITNDMFSLTPSAPPSPQWVYDKLIEHGLVIDKASGIRVFSDYTKSVKGGLQNNTTTKDMEITMSDQEPYWRLGRYIHVIATKQG